MNKDAKFFFTFRKAWRCKNNGQKSFAYTPSFFANLAVRHGFALTVRTDYPHPRGQTMATLTF